MKLASLGAATFDPEGGLYLAGYFEGRSRFGEIDLAGDGDASDAFLARIDAEGKVTAAQRFGGKAQDQARAVAVAGGQVLLGGSFQGSTRLGDRTLDSAGAFDAFVLGIKR
jgi:hypothetical protein